MLIREVKEITRRRRAPGLPPARPKYRLWSDEELRALGTGPDREIAFKLGRSLASVQVKRSRVRIGLEVSALHDWTDRDVKLLGTMTDERLGRRLGLSGEAVFAQRQKLKIASFNPAWRPWTDKERSLVGKVPDQEAAELLGRSLGGVRKARYEMEVKDAVLLVPQMDRSPRAPS